MRADASGCCRTSPGSPNPRSKLVRLLVQARGRQQPSKHAARSRWSRRTGHLSRCRENTRARTTTNHRRARDRTMELFPHTDPQNTWTTWTMRTKPALARLSPVQAAASRPARLDQRSIGPTIAPGAAASALQVTSTPAASSCARGSTPPAAGTMPLPCTCRIACATAWP